MNDVKDKFLFLRPGSRVEITYLPKDFDTPQKVITTVKSIGESMTRTINPAHQIRNTTITAVGMVDPNLIVKKVCPHKFKSERSKERLRAKKRKRETNTLSNPNFNLIQENQTFAITYFDHLENETKTINAYVHFKFKDEVVLTNKGSQFEIAAKDIESVSSTLIEEPDTPKTGKSQRAFYFPS